MQSRLQGKVSFRSPPLPRSMHLMNVPRRLRQIASYARLANSPADTWNLAVLGFVRGHSFAGEGIIARNGKRIFPRLTVRPRIYAGLGITLDPADVSQLVIAEEVLQQNVYDLSKVPFVPDLIIDCGAHIGLFSLLCRAHFPESRINSFEPNPKNFELLKLNVEVNRANIEIVEAAVSIEQGKGSFTSSASCGGQLADEEVLNGYQVSVADLKKYIPRDQSTRLLLKIDIEGTEEKLLPDVLPLLPATTALFMETHDGPPSWERLSKLLEQSGFGTEVVRRHEQFTDGFALRTR
jgi:FkbM family methyltransferase